MLAGWLCVAAVRRRVELWRGGRGHRAVVVVNRYGSEGRREADRAIAVGIYDSSVRARISIGHGRAPQSARRADIFRPLGKRERERQQFALATSVRLRLWTVFRRGGRAADVSSPFRAGLRSTREALGALASRWHGSEGRLMQAPKLESCSEHRTESPGLASMYAALIHCIRVAFPW